MKKILITPPCFGASDSTPLDLLKDKGYELTFNETDMTLPKEEFKKAIADVDAVILGVEKLDAEVMDSAKNLKAVSRYGVGLDNIDLNYAKEVGIEVRNAAGANASGVADTAFAFMLAVSKKVIELDKRVRDGDWRETVTNEIAGKTLGLIGFGNIGIQMAKRAKGFDMPVIAYDVFQNAELAKKYDVNFVDTISELLTKADIVSLHVPHTLETHHLIGKKELDMMKDTAVVINTARGGIIDESALYETLAAKKLLGAGIDVFEQEPLPNDCPLLGLDNIVLSPHGAADTEESILKVSIAASKNVIAMIEG